MTPRQSTSGPIVRATWVFAVPCALFLFSACQQKMANAPYFRPLEQSEFFEDKRASRPIEAGTVSRNKLPDDHPLVTGLTSAGRKTATAIRPGAELLALAGAPSNVKNFVSEMPFTVNEEDVQRGLERFTIYCTPCHSPAGDGNGKIVERGYLKPTNYHYEAPDASEKEPASSTKGLSRGFGRFGLRVAMSPVDPRVTGATAGKKKSEPLDVAPVGYLFEVITRGFGGMPEHASQIPDPYDRWCIVAYIRALQLSRSVQLKDLPPAVRADVEKALNPKSGEQAPGGHK